MNIVLFLDIDGVLNNSNSRKRNPIGVDAKCVDNLFFILYKTNCKVVISSTWRIGGVDAFNRDFQNAMCDANVDSAKINRIMGAII